MNNCFIFSLLFTENQRWTEKITKGYLSSQKNTLHVWLTAGQCSASVVTVVDMVSWQPPVSRVHVIYMQRRGFQSGSQPARDTTCPDLNCHTLIGGAATATNKSGPSCSQDEWWQCGFGAELMADCCSPTTKQSAIWCQSGSESQWTQYNSTLSICCSLQ